MDQSVSSRRVYRGQGSEKQAFIAGDLSDCRRPGPCQHLRKLRRGDNWRLQRCLLGGLRQQPGGHVAAFPACSSAFHQTRFNCGLISVNTKLLVKFPCLVHLMFGSNTQAFVFSVCFRSNPLLFPLHVFVLEFLPSHLWPTCIFSNRSNVVDVVSCR